MTAPALGIPSGQRVALSILDKTGPVIAQSDPAATTNTDLLTVAGLAGEMEYEGQLRVCNRGAGATFRVAIRPLGAAIADAHWITYDEAIAAGARAPVFEDLILSSTDVLTVWASTGDLSFTFIGRQRQLQVKFV